MAQGVGAHLARWKHERLCGLLGSDLLDAGHEDVGGDGDAQEGPQQQREEEEGPGRARDVAEGDRHEHVKEPTACERECPRVLGS